MAACCPRAAACVVSACCSAAPLPAALLIAGLYVSIPYAISSDVAAALGVAQSALIIYFHLGRGESLSHTFRQS